MSSHPETFVCAECGGLFIFVGQGISHHVEDGSSSILHDIDADHVAFADYAEFGEEEDIDYDPEYEFNRQVLNDVMTKNPDLSFSAEEVRDILEGN